MVFGFHDLVSWVGVLDCRVHRPMVDEPSPTDCTASCLGVSGFGSGVRVGHAEISKSISKSEAAMSLHTTSLLFVKEMAMNKCSFSITGNVIHVSSTELEPEVLVTQSQWGHLSTNDDVSASLKFTAHEILWASFFLGVGTKGNHQGTPGIFRATLQQDTPKFVCRLPFADINMNYVPLRWCYGESITTAKYVVSIVSSGLKQMQRIPGIFCATLQKKTRPWLLLESPEALSTGLLASTVAARTSPSRGGPRPGSDQTCWCDRECGNEPGVPVKETRRDCI